MRFGNLATQNEANAGASRLGGEERDKQIGGVGQTWTVIDNQEFHLSAVLRPGNVNAALGFQGRIGGIANQVDE